MNKSSVASPSVPSTMLLSGALVCSPTLIGDRSGNAEPLVGSRWRGLVLRTARSLRAVAGRSRYQQSLSEQVLQTTAGSDLLRRH